MDQAVYEAEIQESSRVTLLKLGLDKTDEKSQGIRDDLELQLDGLTPQYGVRSILELIDILRSSIPTAFQQSERRRVKKFSVRQRSHVSSAYLHYGTMRSEKRWSEWRQTLAFRNLNSSPSQILQ